MIFILIGQSAKNENILACPGKDEARDEEIGQGARGFNLLRDADEEEVDDVEEELEQEVQDGEEVGSLVAGARGPPEEKKSGSKADLDHQSSSVNLNQKPFKCTAPGCSKRFGRKYCLTSHTANIHLEERIFKCEVIG